MTSPGSDPEPRGGRGRDAFIAIEAAVAVVVVVFVVAFLTGAIPELQRLVLTTPLAIGVLIIGTAWIMWRVARPGDRR